MVEKSRWRERWSEEERAKEREIEKQDIERVLTKKSTSTYWMKILINWDKEKERKTGEKKKNNWDDA